MRRANLRPRSVRQACQFKKGPPDPHRNSGRVTNTGSERRSNPCQVVNLSRFASAIGMAAQAGDLDSVPNALAMGAAILPFFWGRTGAGRIGAFLGVCHNPPRPVRAGPFCSRTQEVGCQNRRKRIVAQTHVNSRAESSGNLSPQRRNIGAHAVIVL
jgi:hypothetical protein